MKLNVNKKRLIAVSIAELVLPLIKNNITKKEFDFLKSSLEESRDFVNKEIKDRTNLLKNHEKTWEIILKYYSNRLVHDALMAIYSANCDITMENVESYTRDAFTAPILQETNKKIKDIIKSFK